MPLPLIVALGAVAISGFAATAGVVTTVEKNNQAKDIQQSAEEILFIAQKDMEYYRISTQKCFEKLGKAKLLIAANELKDFVDLLSKFKDINLLESDGIDELLKMNVDPKDITDMKGITSQASQIIGNGLAGIGAGALVGFGVYGGVSTFAAAGTGTAISTLSGAVASNATLAWIGGGTLAAGGFGVAGGAVLLGGLIAAPALALLAGLTSVSAGKNLDNARINHAQAVKIGEQVYTCGFEMHHFCKVAVIIRKNLERLQLKLNKANLRLAEISLEKNNWHELTMQEKNEVALAINYAFTIKALIDMPLLTKDGILSSEAKNAYDEYVKSTQSVYNGNNGKTISTEEVMKWKNENVDSMNEKMAIIDPAITRALLKDIILPDISTDEYLIFAAINKKTESISCYAVVDRNAVDLNDIDNNLFKTRR